MSSRRAAALAFSQVQRHLFSGAGRTIVLDAHSLTTRALSSSVFCDFRGRPERISAEFPVACTRSNEFDAFQRRYGISTSAYRGDAEEPVRSPLSQAPGALQGTSGGKLGDSAANTAQAVLTGIRMSPQKLNMMAEMVRGMRVEDALVQMAVSVKRAAKTVQKVVHSAQANAVHNYGLNKDRLLVAQAFVGKDKFLKRFRPHGKGKAGKMERARCRLTVIVKEMTEETEADLARLRVFRRAGTRMSRSQARLVPHRLLETQWKRQRPPPRPSPSSPEAAAA